MSKIIGQHIGANGKIYYEYEMSDEYRAEWQKGKDFAFNNFDVATGGYKEKLPVNISGAFAEGLISGRSPLIDAAMKAHNAHAVSWNNGIATFYKK